MQKIISISKNPDSNIWENMWMERTIKSELEACKIELAPKLMFLKYLTRKDKIIDGGCGLGKWVIFLYQKGYNIIGIDNNELAIKKVKKYDENIPIKRGNILDIEYPDDSFNGYISMGVVEHFKGGPIKALEEAHRILKPNGFLFVSTPVVNIVRKFIVSPLLNIFYKIPQFIELVYLFRNLIFPSSKFKSKKDSQDKKKDKYSKFYYHFLEYRFTISELQEFLKQTNFEIVTTLPHDFSGSKSHSIGLTVDFPIFEKKNADKFELNFMGKIIFRFLNFLSPWFLTASVLIVAKAIK